jgi:hypothetical protein
MIFPIRFLRAAVGAGGCDPDILCPYLSPFMRQKEYLLRLIYEEKGEINVVITGYLTSYIERYWKEGKGENRV